MERKFNKQLWLESVLKKLYKKVDTLGAVKKPRNHQKKKLTVPIVRLKVEKRKENNKEKGNINSQVLTQSKKQKRLPKKNSKEPSKEEHSEHNEEKFWNYVDEFVQSKPFHGNTKNGFYNSVKIPSTINYTLWKSIGNTIAFPPRVICVTSDKFTLLGEPKEEGYLKTEISPLDEEKILEEKIFLKIQKVRMKRATDAIAKEVFEEINAK